MGQTISSIKEEFQQEAEKEKQANDSLNALMDLADSQASNFNLRVTNETVDVKLIPIDKIIRYQKVIKCNVEEKPEAVMKEITDTFSDFASGDVAGGIGKLLCASMKILFGSYQANSSKLEKYVITTGQLGGLMRLDMFMYSYRYTSEQLTKISKNVLTICVVLSSAKIEGLDKNTLRAIVQTTYSDSTTDEQNKILQQLIKARDDNRAYSLPIAARYLDLAAARSNNQNPDQFRKPPVGTERRKGQFDVSVPPTSSGTYVTAVETFIRGHLFRALGKPLILDVVCVEEESASDQIIHGVYDIWTGKPDRVEYELKECLETLTLETFSAIPVRSWSLTPDNK